MVYISTISKVTYNDGMFNGCDPLIIPNIKLD